MLLVVHAKHIRAGMLNSNKYMHSISGSLTSFQVSSNRQALELPGPLDGAAEANPPCFTIDPTTESINANNGAS